MPFFSKRPDHELACGEIACGQIANRSHKARIAHAPMLFQLHLQNSDFACAAALQRAAGLERVMHRALNLFLVCLTAAKGKGFLVIIRVFPEE